MDKALYRVMGVDYGDVRIGIALSDPTRLIASAYETYTRISWEKDLNHLLQIINDYDVKIVVFGNPLNMDGSSGVRVEKTQKFANDLALKTSAKIDYCDERMSSISAENILISADVSRKKRKQVIDKLAATIILQEYLDTKKGV